jgi:ABC-type branched-subunit amino acid transport system ATPase component
MQSHEVRPVVRRVSDWRGRVQALKTSAVRLQTQRDALARDHAKAVREVEALNTTVERLAKTGELLRTLMDKLVFDQVKAIESVVTEGLKSIFFDQDLSFEAVVGTSRGKIAIDLLIRRARKQIDIVGPPLETVGGGISSIASLTLRLLALMRLKKFPFLLLDETLSAVSDEYVDQTGQFLGKLAETTGIPILLVTHKQSFLDHAKSSYQAHEGPDESLLLKRLRGSK